MPPLLPLKELLILLWVAISLPSLWERAGSLGPSPALLIYIGLWAVLTSCVALAAYVRSRWVRLFYGSLLAASTFFLDSYERITGEQLAYDAFINMVNSSGFAGDALRQHLQPMARSLGTSLLLLAAILLKPRIGLRLPPYAPLAAPVAAVLLLSSILFARGGEGARGLPAPITPLAYATILAYELASDQTGSRQDVALRPLHPPATRDIVLVIDESIGGNYLDINRPGGARSGLGEAPPGVFVGNFGHAASITNCSVGTNVTLRHGGTRDDYQRINATMPPIWQYARRAGFHTVYIDGQRTGGGLHNMMDAGEQGQIEEFVQFARVEVRDRDMAAADRIAKLLGNSRPDFILVNKVGAHFPVHDKFPDSHMKYRPALPRGRFTGISDTGSRAGFGGTPADWREYRNSYRNTIEWNVGAFFDRLFDQADFAGATLIYTSDHGQDLHERGASGLDTHCSTHPVPEEGLVPLVVVKGSGGDSLGWQSAVEANRNRVSHYQIFPTLLALMGYDQKQVGPLYGASLLERSNDPSTFNARFNARLGREPVWKSIHGERRSAENGARLP